MRGLPQQVRLRLDVIVRQYHGGKQVGQLQCDPVVETLSGVTTANVRGKVRDAVNRMLIGYNVSDGAQILIDIGPAEPDELSRPDPE